MIPRFDDREIQAVSDVIHSGKLSPFFRSFMGGEQIQSFEHEFADYLGVKYAVAVSNGTVSLEIVLKTLKLRAVDEVIVSPLSFISSATSILVANGNPVFVDINPQTLNIDPALIEQAITRKTKAIIAVSLFGMPAPMEEIMEIAEKYKIFVLEDSAQSLGASIGDKKIGTWGNAGSFSFQDSKQITTLGEGGLIVTDNDILAEKCRNIRNHGNVYGNLTDIVSTNARMCEANATFGRVQLQKLDYFNKIQIENAKYFCKHIKSPLLNSYKNIPDSHHPIYLLLPAIIDHPHPTEFRQKLIDYLTKKGISKGVPGQNVGYYKSLIYENKIFRPYMPLKNAEYARDHLILFDIHRWHTKEEVVQYVKVINEFCERR